MERKPRRNRGFEKLGRRAAKAERREIGESSEMLQGYHGSEL